MTNYHYNPVGQANSYLAARANPGEGPLRLPAALMSRLWLPSLLAPAPACPPASPRATPPCRAPLATCFGAAAALSRTPSLMLAVPLLPTTGGKDIPELFIHIKDHFGFHLSMMWARDCIRSQTSRSPFLKTSR